MSYQSIDNQWSTTQIVALVATASLTVGVTAGVAFSGSAQTQMYAPATTVARPAVGMQTAPVRMGAAPQYVNQQFAAPQQEAAQYAEYETVEPVYYQAPQAAATNWAAPLAAAVAAAVGAVVYKVKANASKAVPLVGAFAAGPAHALALPDMQTNSMAPIATALFLVLPTWLLITLFVSTNASGNISGGFDQDYYDASKARGGKLTNEAAVMKGAGVGMYAKKKSDK